MASELGIGVLSLLASLKRMVNRFASKLGQVQGSHAVNFFILLKKFFVLISTAALLIS